MRFDRIVPWVIVLYLAVLIPVSALGEAEYLKITANGVNIRSGPKTSFPIVAKAWEGDLFEFHGKEGQWYKVRMFSVSWRYIHKSLGQVAPYSVSIPKKLSTRRKIFRAFVEAEDRAERKADEIYPLENKWGRPIPGNVEKNIDFMWLLSDRYKLEVAHRFRVQPSIHDAIISEGIEKGW